MPKDEDILQLVSPALLSEAEGPWDLGAGYISPPWGLPSAFGRQRRV